MSVLAGLAASTAKEVRVGIITWRLRRTKPRDMMDHGIPGILVLQEIVAPAAVHAARKAEAAADAPEPSKGRPIDPDESTADKVRRQLLRTTTAQKDKAAQATRHFEELIAVAVTHVRVDGEFEEGSEFEEGDVGGWLPVRIVLQEKQQDAEKGRLWVGSMPPGTVDRLYPEALNLSAPAEVQAALQRFCAESKPASDDGQSV